MKLLRALARAVVPHRLRRLLRAAHRDLVFRRTMRRFLRHPEACLRPGSPILVDLIYGWGNDAFSAQREYLAGCIEQALTSRGPILECGSGLTTILIGAVATKRRRGYWVLEHAPEWAARVQRCLHTYKLDSVALLAKPLKDYGSFQWYDAALESMPDGFSLVICDGPPGTTKGGRYGLAPVMRERLQPGCVILLDDVGREEERAIASRWETELGASLEIVGSAKPYCKMTVMDAPQGGPA